jgi:hypothetical protein
MNRDDLVRDTYAHFGLAMFKAQVLEHGIVNAMVVARMPERARITRSEIDAFMDGQFENTLGQLLRELKKYVAMPGDLAEVRGEALTKRNWLAHNYFRERATEFVTDIGCSRIPHLPQDIYHRVGGSDCPCSNSVVVSGRLDDHWFWASHH